MIDIEALSALDGDDLAAAFERFHHERRRWAWLKHKGNDHIGEDYRIVRGSTDEGGDDPITDIETSPILEVDLRTTLLAFRAALVEALRPMT